MAFRIQRVPRGLNELMSIFGGATPQELEDRVRGTVDLLQMYGLNQERVQGLNNAALAENTNIAFAMSNTQWTVLFDASMTVIKTATVTAIRAVVSVRLNSDPNQEYALASESLGPFGATETGAASCIARLSYPRLCPPGSLIVGRLDILGTDATANCTVGAHFGVVGP